MRYICYTPEKSRKEILNEIIDMKKAELRNALSEKEEIYKKDIAPFITFFKGAYSCFHPNVLMRQLHKANGRFYPMEEAVFYTGNPYGRPSNLTLREQVNRARTFNGHYKPKYLTKKGGN